MTTTQMTGLALVILGAIAVQGSRRIALAGPPANFTNVVQVAPPTGEATDRASILAAFAQARPGDTIQCGRGRYLVGKLISDSTPRLTLLGHPEGTTLRGCDAAPYVDMERAVVRGFQEMQTPAGRATGYSKVWDVATRCGVLELKG